jgi:hypothetical protein
MTSGHEPTTVSGPIAGPEIRYTTRLDYEPVYSIQLANGVIVTRPSGFPPDQHPVPPGSPASQDQD